VLNYVFKKSIHRADTSLNTTYYQEAVGHTNIFLDYLATDLIPQTPPDDFVKLSTAQIAALFGIQEEEVGEFNTTLNGESAFSVEQSESKPFILRINNLLMKSNPRNFNGCFTGISSRSKVNFVSQTIHSSYGSGGYKFTIKRSKGGGELSQNGSDCLNLHQVAYIFDSDTGFLTFHESDSPRFSPNPISWSNPPVFSCYVYRGNFGRLGWHIKDNAIILDETQLLLGKQDVTDRSLIMDVNGSAFIKDLTSESMATFSDIRLKENIELAPINKSVLDLVPVTFNYKKNPESKEFGLIAQEVEKVAPQIIKHTDEHLAVQYDRIAVFLLPIIKEQQERILQLENQLNALKKLMSLD
jgi:hypothetical protein